MKNTLKKIIALSLCTLFIINLMPVSAFAANYKISTDTIQVKNKNENRAFITYEKNKNIVKTAIGHGYRITSVTNPDTGDWEMYVSEKNKKFILTDTNTRTNYIVNNAINYEEDKYLGKYSNREPAELVNALDLRAGIIDRYTSRTSDSYMQHYNTNLYRLKLHGQIASKTSTSSNINTYSYAFKNALVEYDNGMESVFLSLLGALPGVGTMLAYADLALTVCEQEDANLLNGDTGQLTDALKEDIALRINLGVSVIDEISTLVTLASVVVYVVIFVHGLVESRRNFNNFKNSAA